MSEPIIGTGTIIVKGTADEVLTLPRLRSEVVNLHGHTVMKVTFEAGWKWSEHVKPTAGTPSCRVPHLAYVLSGQMVVQMDDGPPVSIKAGEFSAVPAGHDAWIPGPEPCVVIDFTGASNFGKT